MTDARLLTVNAVHELIPGAGRMTAIDKRPLHGPVVVGELGVVGDTQADTAHHGGPDKAVYAYDRAAADRWAQTLGRDIAPGTFGENLTTVGLAVDDALIGERWQVGEKDAGVLFEVRMPRTPCENLAARLGMPRFHLDFAERGEVGAYLKVLRTGLIEAGDGIQVVHRPEHDVSVRDVMTGAAPERWQRLLEAGVDLATPMRRKAEREARKRRTASVKP